ncbi:MAG TPA: hypothetical protein VKQ30_05555 [Ktedonobacterales bacterium]|nr:hypothetical protein [Ktedonobacterales bacterium]
MARTLYRIYLYGVWLLLMIFVTVAVGVVLGTLLAASPLNGPSQTTLTGAVITQQIVLALLAVIIAGSLGGLHYWLIRRDIRDDPSAASGPVRALFLNGVEAGSVLVGVPMIANAFASLANPYSGGIANLVAGGLVALGLFALLEAERRQFSVAPGAAIVFQRLHLYGIQLVLLFIAASFWLNAIDTSATVIFVNAGLLTSGCGSGGICAGAPELLPNLVWLWAGAAVVTLAIVGYGYLSRHDGRSVIRLVMHYAAYTFGLIFVIVAVDEAASLLVSLIQSQTVTASDFLLRYEFIAPATFGVLAVAVYASWLARDALRDTDSAQALGLTTMAVTIAVLAVPFWIGCALLAYNLLISVSPAIPRPSADQWTSAVALLIAGIGYIPFSLRMRVLARRYTPATARRGLVFALLGAGTLTAAAGLVVMLYAIVTNVVGAALDNWQTIARGGGVTLLIGVIVSGIYFSRVQVEGWFHRAAPVALPAAGSPEAPSPVAVTSTDHDIEDVLDAVLAGRLTRDEAAARLRGLSVSRI